MPDTDSSISVDSTGRDETSAGLAELDVHPGLSISSGGGGVSGPYDSSALDTSVCELSGDLAGCFNVEGDKPECTDESRVVTSSLVVEDVRTG